MRSQRSQRSQRSDSAAEHHLHLHHHRHNNDCRPLTDHVTHEQLPLSTNDDRRDDVIELTASP